MTTIQQANAERQAAARRESIRTLVTTVTDPQRAQQEQPKTNRF